ncbi:MAG: type II CAAX endopeptidase family protein [bacterium]
MSSDSLLIESASSQATVIVGLIYAVLLLGGTLTAITLIIRTTRIPAAWPVRIEWLRSRPWTWREGMALIGMVGLLIGASWAIASLLKHPREGTLLIMQGLTLDLAGIGGIAWLLQLRGWRWSEAFGLSALTRRILKQGFFFYITLIPFILVSSMIYQGILAANGYPPNLQEIALLLSGDYPLWMRIVMVFFATAVAPFFEECLFRGVLLPLAVRRFGLGAGIFLSSLLFASIHFHLPSLIPLLVAAAGFSLAYLYSQSLWVPIIMHGIFNGVNLALLLVIRH